MFVRIVVIMGLRRVRGFYPGRLLSAQTTAQTLSFFKTLLSKRVGAAEAAAVSLKRLILCIHIFFLFFFPPSCSNKGLICQGGELTCKYLSERAEMNAVQLRDRAERT